jgi:hypothetical protein
MKILLQLNTCQNTYLIADKNCHRVFRNFSANDFHVYRQNLKKMIHTVYNAEYYHVEFIQLFHVQLQN